MIRVGVLRGGAGTDYEQSLASGAYVLKHLPHDRYEVYDVYIDTEGVWHLGGTPVSEEKLRHRIDVIWNTLSGYFGADGKLQQLLEKLGIQYTGSDPLTSAIVANRKLQKDRLATLGIVTPRGLFVDSWGDGVYDAKDVDTVVATVSKKFSPPWIVTPTSRVGGSDFVIAKTRIELAHILQTMCQNKTPVLIEEAVIGQEVRVVASSGFRGQKTYTFLPVEKNRGAHKKLKREERDIVQRVARSVHEGLELGSYSCIHAVVSPKGRVYVTGVDTVLAVHPESDFHEALTSVGSSFREFSEHVLSHARARKI
ncbi:MAG: hypothetical protein WCG55_00265 [bacterium]